MSEQRKEKCLCTGNYVCGLHVVTADMLNEQVKTTVEDLATIDPKAWEMVRCPHVELRFATGAANNGVQCVACGLHWMRVREYQGNSPVSRLIAVKVSGPVTEADRVIVSVRRELFLFLEQLVVALRRGR